MKMRTCILSMLLTALSALPSWGAPVVPVSARLPEVSPARAEDAVAVNTEQGDTILAALGALPLDYASETDDLAGRVKFKLEMATLPAVPSAFLLTLVGFLCITFVRDRRKWAALAVATVSLCQSGLVMLPRLVAEAGHAGRVHLRVATKPREAETHHLSLSERTPEIGFVGLLRRLGAEPRFDQVSSGAFSPPAESKDGYRAAGSFVLAALPVDGGVAIQSTSRREFLPRRKSIPSVKQPIAFALFARPPPVSA